MIIRSSSVGVASDTSEVRANRAFMRLSRIRRDPTWRTWVSVQMNEQFEIELSRISALIHHHRFDEAECFAKQLVDLLAAYASQWFIPGMLLIEDV